MHVFLFVTLPANNIALLYFIIHYAFANIEIEITEQSHNFIKTEKKLKLNLQISKHSEIEVAFLKILLHKGHVKHVKSLALFTLSRTIVILSFSYICL
jgi:hypothetical protein